MSAKTVSAWGGVVVALVIAMLLARSAAAQAETNPSEEEPARAIKVVLYDIFERASQGENSVNPKAMEAASRAATLRDLLYRGPDVAKALGEFDKIVSGAIPPKRGTPKQR